MSVFFPPHLPSGLEKFNFSQGPNYLESQVKNPVIDTIRKHFPRCSYVLIVSDSDYLCGNLFSQVDKLHTVELKQV